MARCRINTDQFGSPGYGWTSKRRSSGINNPERAIRSDMERVDADKAMRCILSGLPAIPVSIWKRLYLSILRQKTHGRSGKPGPARA
ncbi:hypothetical protein AA12467_0960 [Gluconobacter sphaericus NBRC 12467]|nr:hypothetical protein AA12467_0960 [Gluconobacter sphaericus NBRC 12467]